MKKGNNLKFVTNIYNPEMPDFFDKFLNKNIPEQTRKVMVEKIKEYLKQFVTGEPRITSKMNPETIESENIVGLYSLPTTRKEAINFFSFSGTKKKNKKDKVSENVLSDDPDYTNPSDVIDVDASTRETEFMDPVHELLINKINEMMN